MSMSEAFSLFYFNKTLLHQSSERSSLVSGPGLISSPPEAKNPGVFRGSATTFHRKHRKLIVFSAKVTLHSYLELVLSSAVPHLIS